MFVNRILLLFSIATFFSIETKAQSKVKLGIYLGPSLSSVNYTPEPNHNGSITPDYRIGYLIGIDANIKIARKLAMQFQPRFLNSSYVTNESSITNEANGMTYNMYVNKYKLNKLDLPINIIYNITDKAGGLFVLFGPSVGMLLNGTRTYNSEFSSPNNTTVISGKDEIVVKDTYQLGDNRYYIKRWDFGIQAGIGYRFNRLSVQGSYRIGLVNIGANSGFQLPSPKIYSRLAELQAAFYLIK